MNPTLPSSTPAATGVNRATVTLLIPVLNEVVGMRAIMPQVNRAWVDQILFVDGGSTDGTIEYLKENGYEYLVQNKRGIRHAYMEALPLIRGEIILTFSPDGNSVPELIPVCIEEMHKGFDMVIVSRYLKGATSSDDDFITGFGNWLFTKMINVLNGGRYTDAMVMYRAYRRQIIQELELDLDKWYATPERLFKTRVSWEPMLSARAARSRMRLSEVPGDEPPRIGGERKLQVWKWGAVFLFQIFRDVFCWPRGHRSTRETQPGGAR